MENNYDRIRSDLNDPDHEDNYVDIETVLAVSESDFEKGWIDFVNEKY